MLSAKQAPAVKCGTNGLDPTPARLGNIATRGLVQTSDRVMIGGFIIGGSEPAKIVVRALGPSLTAQGVSGALEDPTLDLFDSNGNGLSNDNWRATQEIEITAAALAPSDDREAAIFATLVPGSYTAIVRGEADATGVGLVEVYNVP